MFISDVIGYQKPDVRAFQTIQKIMNLNPEETWFVGDTFEVDVVGAKNAGWHVIWFNHRIINSSDQIKEGNHFKWHVKRNQKII